METDIGALSEKFGVNAEKKTRGGFPVFLRSVANKKVLVLADETTARFSDEIFSSLSGAKRLVLPSPEPVADEETVERVVEAAGDCDYILAVGAGTLNDLGKYAATLLKIKSGIYATAPSMDGFTSGVTPLIRKGFKVTVPAQVVSDVLIDYSLLQAAPRRMIGAGVGDVLAKFCCLTDWKISHILTGEAYNEEAAALMGEALSACTGSLPELAKGKKAGVEKLMNALLVSGYAMVIAGNSRPASGAEHHMSHFLEMDFLRRGLPIPLHGVKVGLGTLVSLYLYHTLQNRAPFAGREKVYEAAEKLPPSEEIAYILEEFDCPTRFSELGVSRETVKNMLLHAHEIRDRYTILTLYHQMGFMHECAEEVLDRFY